MAVYKRNGKKFNKAIKLAVTIATLGMFIACGDDSSSSAPEQTSESIESTDTDLVVKAFDDLPVCSNKREGSTAYVKDEKVAYVCEDGDWTPDPDENVNKKSSSSGKASSSSSKKTQSSSSNDKAKSSSSGKASFSSNVSKTSSSSSDKETSSSSFKYEQDSSAYVQPKVVAVKNKSISGLSQKGPFVTGSTVKLYELDGKTFAQTGKSFSGKITSDDGKFSVSSVSLASQYALLEVTGYFRNEVTGEKSKGTITLNALTDLSDRKNVNVNLLTHLEYERVLHLIESGINFTAAKKQAEAEILNAFGINGEFANSEDLDIFGKGDGNAALLAISVLMLGGTVYENGIRYSYKELSEAELTERLTKFATDIAKDGSWDDEKTKAIIAYNVMGADFFGGPRSQSVLDFSLRESRISMENWKLGGVVPDFEKYVRNYWYTNYGIGNCDSQNEGKVELLKPSYDGNDVWGICRNGSWKKATYLDVDLHNAKIPENPKDGDFWTETETGNVYKYFQNEGVWVYAQFGEVELNIGGCTPKRNGEITNTDDGVYFICKKNDHGCYTTQCLKDSDDCYCLQSGYEWDVASELEYDTYGMSCTSKDVGKIIDGVVSRTGKYYCMANGWISLMSCWSWSNFWDVPKEARLNPEITYGTIIDSRDENVYKTVKIGDQVWMAENLNYADSTTTPSLKGRNWCYENKAGNCSVVGRLYTWAAAIDSVALYDGGNGVNCGYGQTCLMPEKVQGICPEGWHLPSSSEWQALFVAVGGQSTAGKILKSQTGWFNDCEVNSFDSFGFSVLPAGRKDYDGSYDYEREKAYFWSSTEDNSGHVYYLSFWHSDDYVSQNFAGKNNGFSIRCLKD